MEDKETKKEKKLVKVVINNTEYEFEKNEEKTCNEIITLVYDDASKYKVSYKNEKSEADYKILGENESIKMKEKLIIKVIPKTITNGYDN